MQIEMFDAYSSGFINRINRNMMDSVEDQVNRWLDSNPDVRVVEVKQSAAGGSWGPIQLLISVWYESAE